MFFRKLLEWVFPPRPIAPLWMRCGAIQKVADGLNRKVMGRFSHIEFPIDRKMG